MGGAAGRAPEQGWGDQIGADNVSVPRATERSCGGAMGRRGGANKKTTQPEQAAGVFLPGQRINRSGFMTEAWEPREWLEGASPETRTD